MSASPFFERDRPWLRRVDDAIFRLEQGLVASFLAAMTLMVFLDVVYRRLTAPDTKLAGALASLLNLDASDRAWVDRYVAPYAYAALGLAALWMCFRTAERERHAPFLSHRHGALALALASTGGLAGLGWMMLHASSALVYGTLGGLCALAASVHSLRQGSERKWLRVVGVWLAAGAFAGLAFAVLPEGYSWSKEVSLMLLLWVGFLGASVCVHEGKHLRMEAASKLAPESLRPYVSGLGMVSAAVFAGFMALLGYRYVFDPEYGARAMGGVFEQTGIPDWIATSAVPVAFGLTCLRFVAAAISAFTGGAYGSPAPPEGLQEARDMQMSTQES